MILKKISDVNTQFKDILQLYSKTINFGVLSCSCHSTNLIKWGTYKRYVVYYDKYGNLITKFMTIQRVRCKDCGKTHAILPLGIVPYKQFVLEVIINILNQLLDESIENVALKNDISISTIKRWYYQFKNIHQSKLMVFYSSNYLKDIFRTIKDDLLKFNVSYFKQFKNIFMQTKITTS